MSRYIDAVAEIEKATHKLEFGKITLGEYEDLIRPFRQVLTADVAEVKHGRWVRKKNIVGQEITVCSVCGEMKRQATGNYCGMCGAKMSEVSE